jgi:hypothetical protein
MAYIVSDTTVLSVKPISCFIFQRHPPNQPLIILFHILLPTVFCGGSVRASRGVASPARARKSLLVQSALAVVLTVERTPKLFTVW